MARFKSNVRSVLDRAQKSRRTLYCLEIMFTEFIGTTPSVSAMHSLSLVLHIANIKITILDVFQLKDVKSS